KRLVGGSFAGQESRRRLEVELEATSTIASPYIVRVFGIDVIDDQPMLAMEWVEGESITSWARRHPERLRDRLEVFAAVCDGVQHAEQGGVLHRDLKPSNIMIDVSRRPRLLDFGLAKLMAPGSESITQTRQFIGTPGYAPPEQIASGGAAADVRGDIYSLGVV